MSDEEKGLVKTGSSAMMGLDRPEMEGMESMLDQPGTIKMPYLTVCQNQSKAVKTEKNTDGIPAGHLYNSITMQHCKTMQVVFAMSGYARSLRDEDNVRRSLCWSLDGRVPSPAVQNPRNIDCANCKDNRNYAQATRGKCGLQLKWLVFPVDAGESGMTDPMVLMHGSTAFKPANDLMNKYLHLKKNLRTVVLTLTTEEEENDKGRWYKLVMKDDENSTTEQQQLASDLYHHFKNKDIAIPEDQDGPQDDTDEDVPF